MSNLNFPLGTPLLTTKLVGFDTPIAYGERTYTVGDLLTLVSQNIGAFTSRAVSNASGNTELSIESTSRYHTEVVTLTGAARTSEIVVPTTGRVEGDIVVLKFVSTSPLVSINVRNATVSGTILSSLYSGDGNAVVELYFDGTSFQILNKSQPSA
jgi:hypothetical protein